MDDELRTCADGLVHRDIQSSNAGTQLSKNRAGSLLAATANVICIQAPAVKHKQSNGAFPTECTISGDLLLSQS